MSGVFRKTVAGDWHFDYLSVVIWWYLWSLVVSGLDWSVLSLYDWSSKRKSCSDWSFVVLLLFSIRLLFVEVYIGFGRGHVWVVCKVQVAVGIASEGLVLSLFTSFLMLVVVGSLCCKWRVQHNPSRWCLWIWVPDITVIGRSFVFSQSCFQVSANISSLTVSTFDSVYCSLSVVRSLSLTLVSLCLKVVIGLWATRMSLLRHPCYSLRRTFASRCITALVFSTWIIY